MLIQNLKASGLLSFGPNGIDLPMRPLNVLIGANGSLTGFGGGLPLKQALLDLERDHPGPERRP